MQPLVAPRRMEMTLPISVGNSKGILATALLFPPASAYPGTATQARFDRHTISHLERIALNLIKTDCVHRIPLPNVLTKTWWSQYHPTPRRIRSRRLPINLLSAGGVKFGFLAKAARIMP
jgi:hypothetical protein